MLVNNNSPMFRADLLDKILDYVPVSDLVSCAGVCKLWNDRVKNNTIFQASPKVIEPGVIGATVIKNDEEIYLRMELITQENTRGWHRYAELTKWMANDNSRGVLSSLLLLAGTERYPSYEDVEEVTGFTPKEYEVFTNRLVELKERTNDKIVTVIKANSGGSGHMSTGFFPDELRFIVYASKNPDFSIKGTLNTEAIVKNYIEAYSDILMSVGTCFSGDKKSFHNRGIFRNPYWVIEEKYSGLSMLLHGMTGAVAEKFFPEKDTMLVKPLGSMQVILKKYLNFGDGYIEEKGEKKDITELEVSPTDPECAMNYISVSGLSRIFYEAVHKLEK